MDPQYGRYGRSAKGVCSRREHVPATEYTNAVPTNSPQKVYLKEYSGDPYTLYPPKGLSCRWVNHKFPYYRCDNYLSYDTVAPNGKILDGGDEEKAPPIVINKPPAGKALMNLLGLVGAVFLVLLGFSYICSSSSSTGQMGRELVVIDL